MPDLESCNTTRISRDRPSSRKDSINLSRALTSLTVLNVSTRVDIHANDIWSCLGNRMLTTVARWLLRYGEKQQTLTIYGQGLFSLRGQDLNLRPPGYEPGELPNCSTPRHKNLL